MRWATYRHPDGHPGSGADRVGLVVDAELRALPPGRSLVDLLGDGGERLAGAADEARRSPEEVVALDEVVLRPPVPHPPSVRDFYAFEAHVRTARKGRGLDVDPGWYEQPVFYFTNPHVMHATGDPVAVPPGCEELDYELEVAAVVGRPGSDLDPPEAEEHIAGYTVMNDWSARDLQRREMRQGLGPAKGKDFATTLGPFLVTPDELADRRSDRAFDLTMTAAVNGEEWSRGSLADLHWSFAEMVAYASRGSRVEPGDVVGSGTVGTGCILELAIVHGAEARPWLRPGDGVSLTVERLGTVTNTVVAGAPPRPLRAGEVAG